MNKDQRVASEVLYSRGKHPYPRGGLRLFPVLQRNGGVCTESFKDFSEVEKFARFNRDVYVNLFSDDQKRSKEYDMLFLDIDNADLNKSFEYMKKVTDSLNNADVAPSLIMFSGSKGFHVYVRFPTTMLSSYRKAVTGWLKEIGVLEYVDVPAIEPNRVTRVPYSRNTKGGYCIPISYDFIRNGMEFILDMSEKGVGGRNAYEEWLESNEELPEKLRAHDQTEVESEKDAPFGDSGMFASVREYPPCMQRLYNEAKKGTDLGHHQRLELGKFLLHVSGGDVDGVADMYSKMSDYNDRVTRYQLQYIMDRGLKMNGCDTMMDQGMCVFDKCSAKECPFYPTINRFLK